MNSSMFYSKTWTVIVPSHWFSCLLTSFDRRSNWLLKFYLGCYSKKLRDPFAVVLLNSSLCNMPTRKEILKIVVKSIKKHEFCSKFYNISLFHYIWLSCCNFCWSSSLVAGNKKRAFLLENKIAIFLQPSDILQGLGSGFNFFLLDNK